MNTIQTVVRSFFPPSPEAWTIMPNHLADIGRAQLFGTAEQGDLVITDIHCRRAFLAGGRLTPNIQKWLIDYAGTCTTIFGVSKLLDEIVTIFPNLSPYVSVFASYELSETALSFMSPLGFEVRPVSVKDVHCLANLNAGWLWAHLNNPAELFQHSNPFGAYVDGQLAALAVDLFKAGSFGDIGTAASPSYRRQGFAYASCTALLRNLVNAGIMPVWNTLVGHQASESLAQKLGFKKHSNYQVIWIR